MRLASPWTIFGAFALVVQSPAAAEAASSGRMGLWVEASGDAKARRVDDVARSLGEALRGIGRQVVMGEEALSLRNRAPDALPVAQCLHDTPCLVEVGRAANLHDLVVGVVGERAGAWSLTLDRVHMGSAKVARHVFHDTGGNHSQLVAASADLIRRLFPEVSAPVRAPTSVSSVPLEEPPVSASAQPSPGATLRWAAYGALGSGVLLGAVGAAYGFGVRNAAAEVTGRCCLEVPSGRPIYDLTRVEALEMRQDVRQMGELSNIMYGAGLVAVGAGAVLWFLSEGDASVVAWRPGQVDLGVVF